jgi:hypothetical protein
VTCETKAGDVVGDVVCVVFDVVAGVHPLMTNGAQGSLSSSRAGRADLLD